MATTIRLDDTVEIPGDIRSLADFRRWALSDRFPETGRIDYLGGLMEIDMSPEDVFTHGTVKVEIVRVLAGRVASARLGILLSDSSRVFSPTAELSVEPDVVFISEQSLDSGRVRLVPHSAGQPDRCAEIEGPPDLVVEVVSNRSLTKDTRDLFSRYFAAGVGEYWLVDARREELFFRIHRRGNEGFEPADADADGYQRSEVLSRWYRLDRSRNAKGRIAFHLLER